MLYPVKIEFATNAAGPWTDWSQYLSEAPNINRKVESENAGEAGLIVFDKASVSFYYAEGNPVYTAFSNTNLTAAQRYLFRISAHNSSGVYIPLFEGMVDFSTIEWPDKSRLITFEIFDKLSAISILEAKKCKTLTSLKNTSSRGLPSLNYSDGEYYVITVGTSLISQGIIHIEKWVRVGGILTHVIVNQTLKTLNAGEILFAGNPLDEESGRFYFPTASILKDNGYDNIDTYVFGTSDSNDVSGVYKIDSSNSDAYLISDPSIKLKYYPAVLYGYDFQKISNLPPPGFPLDATDTVIGFDGVKTIIALVRGQWGSALLIDRMGEFIIPLEYWKQLIFEDPFSETPLDALKMLADSMRCYIYFDKEGKLVVQKKASLATNGTTRSFGSSRVLDATRKYFWDKLIDGVTVEVKSWVKVNEEYLTGTGSLYKQITGSNSYVKPKNELTKKTLAGSSSMDTQGELDSYAAQLADEYMSFYGVRRESWSYSLSLDDNTMLWDLLDNIPILTSDYFFTQIEYNLSERIIDIEFINIAGSDYDLRQVAITQSESSYASTSSGGSYSGGGGTSASDYLWSGTAVGLNSSLARQSLGLQNIANLGDGIITNTEFNHLAGVTSNIQTQLNSKENVLSFTDPLVRTGNQITITTGAFSLGANSNGFILSGTGKPVGGDIAIAFPQRLDQSGTPQFAKMGIGGAADAGTNILKVYGDAYFTGVVYIAGAINQVNVTDLYVSDKNIILNKNGTTSTASDAGLKVEGDSSAVIASLLYDGTNWTHSHDINTASGKGYKVNGTTVIDSDRNFSGAAGSFTGQLAWNGNSRSDNGFVFFRLNGNAQTGRFRGLQVSTTYTGTIPDNGILFSTDANLYRSAAGILKTDNHLLITGYHASPNYVSQTTGWRVSSLGEADFRYLYSDEIHTKAFIADLEQALAGGQIIGKSVAKIAADFTLPAAGGQVVIEFESFAGFPNSYAFQNNDWLEIKKFDRPVTADTIGLDIGIAYGRVTFSEFVSGSNPPSQRWTFTRDTTTPGTASGIVKAGTLAIDKGVSGNGYYEVSAIDGQNGINSPYAQTVVWYDHPANKFVGARLGNMRGIAGNPWGEQAIHGLYADVAWLTENVLIGGRSLGLISGMTALFHYDDNLYDSIGGVKPSYTGAFNETNYGLITAAGLVATKANGKFGGGVTVEEATTNMLGVNDANFENGSGSWGVYYGIAGFERTSAASKFGSYSLKINGNGSANGGVQNANAAGLRWAVSANTTYTVSGYALSPNLRLTRLWIRQYDASATLITNTGPGQIAPLAWTKQSYTFTTTSTTASVIIDLYVYNLATGESVYWDGLQLEQKSYSTSFAEGSRSAGKLIYTDVINPSAYTVSVYAYIDLTKMGYYGRIIDIALDVNNRLQLCRYDTTNNMQFAVITDGTVRINRTSFVLSNGWHKFTLSYANSQYYIGVDGAAAYPADVLGSSYGASSNWKLSFGTDYAGSSFSNCIYDEASIWNRGITENEDRKIYYSNQPLQESPGMTYISGNKIRTGYIYSENYDKEKYGMMIGLNSGYMEMNFGGANIFKFDSAGAAASIAGWNITERWINKTLATVNGYLLKLDTMTTVGTTHYERPRLEIGWGDGVNVAGYGGNYITLGASSYMQTANGVFTVPAGGNWDINDGCGGLSVNVNGENILFAGRRKLVDGTYISGAAIAGWSFNKSMLFNGNVRLEVSASFTGLAIKSGTVDRVKIGDFTGTHPDTSINSTSTYMNDPNFTGSLISYATSGYGSTPGAWATRGTLTWSITSGYLQIYSAALQPSADTWVTFKNPSSLNNKTVLIEFDLTVASNDPASWTPRVLMDFRDGDVYGNGTDMSKFSQYLLYSVNGTYHISAYVTFGTGAYKVMSFSSGSGPNFKIVRLDNFTIKEYPDVYTYINGSGFEVYKSPVEYFSFLNGNFNIALNELYINGIFNVSKTIVIGNYKIVDEGDKLAFYKRTSTTAYSSVGYLIYSSSGQLN